MKLSIYTAVKDGIYFDFHVEAMLRQHLPLADEIIVNEGHSSDDTFERISRIDPKIKIFREPWEPGAKKSDLYVRYKDHARERCTGDWCLLLDSDEFVPEWEFDRIRREIEQATKPIYRLHFTNFYGNYRVYHANPAKRRWASFQLRLHRNQPDIRMVGDGSNVAMDSGVDDIQMEPFFECHHMGTVRSAARLRQKWRIQSGWNQDVPKQDRTPGFLFNFAPHDWFDKDFLEDLRIYDGPLVQEVRNNPDEFVRDDMKLFKYLSEQGRA